MPDKAVFLDRDGTLVVDAHYAHKLSQLQVLPGVVEGLQRLASHRLIIVTNQSGIGRGFFSEADMHRFNAKLIEIFAAHDIRIEHVFFCPHHPEDHCNCRKPQPGLIRQAARKFDLDLSASVIIGDKAGDVELAKNTGCRSIFVLTGKGSLELPAAVKLDPDYVAADLDFAAKFVTAPPNHKTVSRNEVAELAMGLKSRGKRIVTCNGTFDILHPGHAKILSEGRQQGDALLVGINSDTSVRANKGPQRPINNERARAMMLTQRADVDYVFVFDEETPIPFLEQIRPDVHVNGSEYGENCIEAATVKKFGGRLHIVNLLAGYSSTRIIKGT
jgi:D-glycero-D-manno-heptose 1,7-bisphosphate phosphatase